MKLKTTLGLALGLALGATSAFATNLRIQTHYAPETVSGKLAQEYVDDVIAMSNGEISIEMFWSSSVVKSVETFDAAATGILDCDFTGGGYQTGKNPAFQFVGDIMGGYSTPYQQLSWLYYGGGREAAKPLYNKYGMELIGWWIYGQESFASSKPIEKVEDFKGWKFRSGLANNVGLGLYDIVKYANFPGFHSMPSDHLACNKGVFDAMPAHHQKIMKVGFEALALRTALTFEKKNAEAAAKLRSEGVTLSQWAPEELAKFRAAAQATWPEFATTPEAKALVESHMAYLRQLGLVAE